MAHSDNGRSTWGLPRNDGSPDFTMDKQSIDNTQSMADTTMDRLQQGFENIMARFDRLESRMDVTDRRVNYLEPPIIPDPDPPYTEYDQHDAELCDRWDDGYRETAPRNFNYGSRESSGDSRRIWNGPFGEFAGYNRSRNARPNAQFQGPRQQNWGAFGNAGQRPPTCWDHPNLRQQFAAAGYARPVKMDAPNWQSSYVFPQPFAAHQGQRTCWDRTGSRMLQEFPAYDAPPARQPSCWDPPKRYIQRRVSAYNSQPDYQAPCPQHTVPDSYVQLRNTSAEYHPWKQEYRPARQIPLPDCPPPPPPQAVLDQQQPLQLLLNSQPPPSHCRSAALTPVAAAPSLPLQSDRLQIQPGAASPIALPPNAAPRACQPLQPLPMTTTLLAATPLPQAMVPSPMENEGELLDDVPYPPVSFSPSCNPIINPMEEYLLEDGVVKNKKTIEQDRWTLIVEEIELHNGDENGLKDEVVNYIHEVSYPSVRVSALTYAGGSEITKEVAWIIFDEVHHMRDREKDVWQESIVKVRWKGLVVGKRGAVSDTFKFFTGIFLCTFDPGICGSNEKEKLHIDNVSSKAMDMLLNDDKELSYEKFIKCLFATNTFRIGLNVPAKPVVFANVQKFNGDDVGGCSSIQCVFDPGGDSLSKFQLSVSLFVASCFPP